MCENEVAQDRVAFPENEIAFDQCRNATIRVHFEIMRLIVVAEGHAGIDPFDSKIKFVRAPQHLLHIDRIGTAPNCDLRRDWHGRIALPE